MDGDYKRRKREPINLNLPNFESYLRAGHNQEGAQSSAPGRRPYQTANSRKPTTERNKNTVDEGKKKEAEADKTDNEKKTNGRWISSSVSNTLIPNLTKGNTKIQQNRSEIPTPLTPRASRPRLIDKNSRIPMKKKNAALNKSDGNKKKDNDGRNGDNEMKSKEQSTNIEDLSNHKQQNKGDRFSSLSCNDNSIIFIECTGYEGCCCTICDIPKPKRISVSLEIIECPNTESRTGTSSSIVKVTPELSSEEDMKETSESSSLSFFTDKSSVSVSPLGDLSEKTLLDTSLGQSSINSGITEKTVKTNSLFNNDFNETIRIEKSKEDEKSKGETQTEETDEEPKKTKNMQQELKEQKDSDLDTDSDSNDDNENDEVEDEEKNEESEASMLVDDNLEAPKHQQPKELTLESEEELQKKEELKKQRINNIIKKKLKDFSSQSCEKGIVVWFDNSVSIQIFSACKELLKDSNLEAKDFIWSYINKNIGDSLDKMLITDEEKLSYSFSISFDKIKNEFIVTKKKDVEINELNDNDRKGNKTTGSFLFFIVGFFAIVAVIYFIYILIKKNNEEEEEKNTTNDSEEIQKQ